MKVVKEIKVNIDECTGCCACEMACSAFHATPRYSSINPALSRIRVVTDELNDEYVPVRAGDYTAVECSGRHMYTIDGKDYSECSFCRSACPSRDFFFEPDSGLPMKCDMCETVPALDEPWCVQVCHTNALTYEEREVEPGEKWQDKSGDIDDGLELLVKQYGMEAVREGLSQMPKAQAFLSQTGADEDSGQT